MKPTILIAKGGSVFRTRAATIASGEQGETEGVIRHLIERNDIDLVYFGLYRGEPLCEVIEPSLEGLDDLATGKEQEENFRVDIERLKDRKIIAFIHTSGYSPTFSMVTNPNGAIVQGAAIRYTAPMHNVLNHFRIPRIVINNDPRTYPRDQEMSHRWEYSRPAALLDQCDADYTKVVGGKRYRVRSVHARAESWAWQELGDNESADPCVTVAHAHFATGIKNNKPGRHDAWYDVLGGELPPEMYVYGEGWEHWDYFDRIQDRYEGKCTPQEALELFRLHACGPVVSHTPGFYTGKPYVMMSQGCIPLLHESYDPKGLFMPVDSPYRIRKPGDLYELAMGLWDNDNVSEAALAHWSKVLKPDWTLLDRLVDDLVAGRAIDQSVYGGYSPL